MATSWRFLPSLTFYRNIRNLHVIQRFTTERCFFSTSASNKNVSTSISSQFPKDLSMPRKESKENFQSFLASIIMSRGPLTIAQYISYCLTHPDYGYYTSKDSVFGKEGDFITSPEISQMFGELIGIWCVSVWQQMKCPKKFQLIELGPGKGTLQADLLRAAIKFPDFYNALQIELVEVSPIMRRHQQEAIYARERPPKVRWYDALSDVPTEYPTIIIAQEFFDALPIHQFQFTERGWCEQLIDICPEDMNKLRYVLAPNETPARRAFLPLLDIEGEPKAGDIAEVSPASISTALAIADRIREMKGAALIVDYGHNYSANKRSLRGIRNHKFVDELENPGVTDLSIDVDFCTLKKNIASLDSEVAVYGPVYQKSFLQEMGIEHRLATLLQKCDNEKMAENLYKSYERLTTAEQMGTIFKVMGIMNKEFEKPAGFESEEVQD